MSTIDQMAAHLEFLGYEIVREEKRTRASHKTKLNFSMRRFAGGVLFTVIFGCKPQARIDKLGYLTLVNGLNVTAKIARFYADDELDFFIEAWHPDLYDRAQFGVFMESWDEDCDRIFETDEVSRYLE